MKARWIVVILCLAGGAVLADLAGLLISIHTWRVVWDPPTVGQIVRLGASVLTSVGAALKLDPAALRLKDESLMNTLLKDLINLFKKIGHLLGLSVNLVHALFSEEQIAHAVGLVKAAAENYTDSPSANTDRREWVAMELMNTLHLPESAARLLAEIAVSLLKREADELIEIAAVKIAGVPDHP